MEALKTHKLSKVDHKSTKVFRSNGISENSNLYRANQIQKKVSLLEDAFNNVDDTIIWNKFKLGNKSVFTYIYYKYFAELCRYGSQFVADKDQVKDHIHDLFIELFDRRKKLSKTNSVKFYLMKCLKNRMLAMRKKQRVFLRDECETKGYDFEISFSIEQSIIHDQNVEERNNHLNTAIKKLSKRQREVVYYYYFEELSILEIMELMDCGNAKSIQNLLYRSIYHLREYI